MHATMTNQHRTQRPPLKGPYDIYLPPLIMGAVPAPETASPNSLNTLMR
jgi:hypothetical protein